MLDTEALVRAVVQAGGADPIREWSAVPLVGSRVSPSSEVLVRLLDPTHVELWTYGWLLLMDATPALAVTADGRVHVGGKSRDLGSSIWGALSLIVSLLEW